MAFARPVGRVGTAPPVYEDVELVGSGSRSTVHRARESGTGRVVALQARRVAGSDARELDRLAVTLAAVSTHPNLVTVHRGFLADDGRHVLALELCAGTLAARVEPGRGLPAQEVVSVGVRIAGAVASAHRVGLLHRAITPWNVMLTRLGEPALAELGVVPAAHPDRPWTGDARSAAFTAPEVLRCADTGAATDVYGLAATLYWLLDGRGPVPLRDGDEPAAVAARVLRDPVARLVDPGVPSSLAELLAAALQKNPVERPADAENFALRLARIEAEQGWARTPLLVRDPDCGIGLELPVVPPVALLSEASTGRTNPERRRRRRGAHREVTTAPSAVGPAAVGPVVLAGEDDAALFTRLLAVADTRPGPYPLPPVAAPEPGVADPVPTWARRTSPAHAPAENEWAGDAWRDGSAAIDPMTLPPGTTLRAGPAHVLVAGDAALQLRAGLHRRRVEWASVRGFVRRYEDGVGGVGSRGLVVALTVDGPIALAATRRPAPQLGELLALLDAYRERALIRAGR